MGNVFYGIVFCLLLSSNFCTTSDVLLFLKTLFLGFLTQGNAERTSVNSSFQLITTQTDKVVVFAESVVFECQERI